MSIAGDLSHICSRPTHRADHARASLHLLDWIGCIVAARHSNAGRVLARYAGQAGDDPLRGWVGMAATAPEQAALIVGGLGNVLEMDDLHRASILHAGDTVCAAALSCGFGARPTGAALLGAITAGYDAAIRVALPVAQGGYTNWYTSSVCGVFGAAMAVARLHGLDENQRADALCQAGLMAAGIWQVRLDPGTGKQIATAQAAAAGLRAARLAGAGAQGPARIFEGDMGLYATYFPGVDPAQITQDPGAPWHLHDVSFKPWPACRHTHPAIAAALAARGQVTTPINQVTLETYRAALDLCDAPKPETDHAARFSLQHAVAVALATGDAQLADFGSEARGDPKITALRARVQVHEDPAASAAFPARYSARIRLSLEGGAVIEQFAPHAPGDPEAPLSQNSLDLKFRRNMAHGGVSADAATAVHRAVMALPDAPDLAPLATALSGALTHARTPDQTPTRKDPQNA